MKIKGLSRIFSNNMLMLKYVFRYMPVYAVIHIILQMAFGFFDILWGIIVMKVVVDAVQQSPSFTVVIYSALFYFLYGAVIQVIAAYYYEVCFPVQIQKLNKNMQLDLYQKAVKIDYSCYNNPQFYNDFVWAASQTEGKAVGVLDSVAALCKSATTVAGISAVMLSLDSLGIVFVLVSFFGIFAINTLINKIHLKKNEELKPLQRKRDYINRVFYLIDCAKEIRTSNIKWILRDSYETANKGINAVIRKFSKKLILWSFISAFVLQALLLDVAYMIIITYKVMFYNMSYGSFAALANGIWSLKWSLQNLSDTLVKFQENSLYIEKFRGFLDYDIKIKTRDDSLNTPDTPRLMELKNVSYTYGGTEEAALKNISMTIRPKEKIAIVGYNGAGKSTLIKLILRLYDPSLGEILYDGTDVRDYKVEDYYNCFGVVFQDYHLFASSIAENVKMDLADDCDYININNALDKSGFTSKLNELENGIQTSLTREFDENGMILSGGEAQKVAIARVFAGNHSILILDEPSSALDPISEYNLNQAMLEAAIDKTVIFISHRLSTTRIADTIYMMEKGRIIEQGSHNELMQMNGKYAEMFRLQSEKYCTVESSINRCENA